MGLETLTIIYSIWFVLQRKLSKFTVTVLIFNLTELNECVNECGLGQSGVFKLTYFVFRQHF